MTSGPPARWAGTYRSGRAYNIGDIVVDQYYRVLISKVNHNRSGPPIPMESVRPVLRPIGHGANRDWADLGRMGASPTKVLHTWNPETLQYPVDSAGRMSEPVNVCKDCWKDSDFRNAFLAKTHLYIIRAY